MMSGLARFWNKDTLCYIMTYVVIIDNTIIEDERNENDPGAMITTKMVARCIGKRGTNVVIHLLSKFFKIHKASKHTISYERILLSTIGVVFICFFYLN